ncbi:MAG TPA: cyclic nucleotide-binding domain-containing protein [archaeon]|nr:cyclic nucleotide-binding domain-containing protein [archaeon]
MEQELINLLKEQELTRDFTESELSELAGLVKTRHYKAGEVIIEEGEKISSIYFLPRGEVDVLKYDDKRENLFTILTLKEGSFFGEMSFVDKEPTSATIRTRTDCTIWVLSKKEVESLPLYDKLIKNIAVCEINRLRITDKDYVESLKIQLKESKLRNDFGHFFIVIIILFCIFNFIPNTAAESPIKQMLLSWGSLIFILIPIVYFVRKILTPISTFGITIDGWKRAVLEGILVSVVLILSLTLLKYFSTPADEPLVTWGTRAQSSRTDLYIYFGLYVMVS